MNPNRKNARKTRKARGSSVAQRIAATLCAGTQGKKVARLVIEFREGPALAGLGWCEEAIRDVAEAEIKSLAAGKKPGTRGGKR